MRGEVAGLGWEAMRREAVEMALATLPAVVDALVVHLERHGAREDTIRVWETVQVYLGDPRLAQDLGQDLGLC